MLRAVTAAPQSPSARPISDRPSLAILMLSLLSTLVLMMFRAEFHRWLPALWIETLALLLIPFALLIWYLRSNLRDRVSQTSLRLWVQAGAVVMVLLVLAVQWWARLGGLGDSNEVVAMLVVQSLGWYAALFSSFENFERFAVVLTGALVLFVCFMTMQTGVLVVGFFFAITWIWWLLGNYWNRLDQKLVDGTSTTLPVNGMALGICVLLLLVVGTLVWALAPARAGTSLSGLPFFSGGEDGQDDEWARAGIGDGNMLAPGENATTTGAVDSNQFIEDDKVSMYDVLSDRYEGPVFRKEHHRAVALDVIAKHMHDVKQSEQSGKSFRTVRKSSKVMDRDFKSRVTNALFFVEGSVPARFAIDSFQHFDGWDWSKVDLPPEDIRPARIALSGGSQPWFKAATPTRLFLTDQRSHRVKIMRLKTSSLPAPAFLKLWHIFGVEKLDMFCWSKSGQIRVTGEVVPTHTVIDMISEVPNYHVLRSSSDLKQAAPSIWLVDYFNYWWSGATRSAPDLNRSGPYSRPMVPSSEGSIERRLNASKTSPGSAQEHPDSSEDSPYLQLADNDNRETLMRLAQDWTRDIPRGWNQVETIVNQLRENYRLDPQLVAGEETADSISHFLEHRGGPSYMFATTAVQLLRAAGYKARMVSGFVVRSEDFIRTAKQSVVSSENAHMWPEVCLDDAHWIPLEPTPGFPIPYSTQTVFQWLRRCAVAVCGWILARPLLSLTYFALLTLLFRRRYDVAAALGWLVWLPIQTFVPRLRLSSTRRLVDMRFWAAGLPRPSYTTINEWYSKVDAIEPEKFLHYWHLENFGSREELQHNRHEISRVCRQLLRHLTVGRIRKHATANSISNLPHQT